MDYLVAIGCGFVVGVWRHEVWAGVRHGARAGWSAMRRAVGAVWAHIRRN